MCKVSSSWLCRHSLQSCITTTICTSLCDRFLVLLLSLFFPLLISPDSTFTWIILIHSFTHVTTTQNLQGLTCICRILISLIYQNFPSPNSNYVPSHRISCHKITALIDLGFFYPTINFPSLTRVFIPFIPSTFIIFLYLCLNIIFLLKSILNFTSSTKIS